MSSRDYCYDHPRPAVTVDLVAIRRETGGIEIVLVQRKNPPFEGKWALPGGFVDSDEPLEAAARRELEEETGLVPSTLDQIGAYGEPGRDPRGHTVSIAFLARIRPGSIMAGDDAADARWFRVGEVPDLAFDHDLILRDALELIDTEDSDE